MDFTNVSIKIINPQKPQLSADTELLVDSGALYSIVPAQFLHNIALGVVTLEVLGLQIDPIRQELKPVPGLLLALGKTNAFVSRYG